jgi:hypothetical protein
VILAKNYFGFEFLHSEISTARYSTAEISNRPFHHPLDSIRSAPGIRKNNIILLSNNKIMLRIAKELI